VAHQEVRRDRLEKLGRLCKPPGLRRRQAEAVHAGVDMDRGGSVAAGVAELGPFLDL
jgi:hypothetical protein